MADVSYIDRIISKVKTIFDQVAKYNSEYTYTDFVDDDIPNVRSVNALIDIAVSGAISPPLVKTYNFGAALPISITDDLTGFGEYPDLMIFYTDTGIQIKNATETRSPLANPTIITVDAANDGTNHLDGNLTIVIKQ